MNKLIRVLIEISMVITWIATFIIAFGSPGTLGKTSIIATGVLLNVALGLWHSYLKTQASSFREWLNR